MTPAGLRSCLLALAWVDPLAGAAAAHRNGQSQQAVMLL